MLPRVWEQKIATILAASQSLMTSPKWRSVLSLVLALGNHLNAGRREPAKGFKLQALNLLNDIKANDHKYTLLHYLADQVSLLHHSSIHEGPSQQTYPELEPGLDSYITVQSIKGRVNGPSWMIRIY